MGGNLEYSFGYMAVSSRDCLETRESLGLGY